VVTSDVSYGSEVLAVVDAEAERAELLAAVEALAPEIAARTAELDAGRRLPLALVAQLKAAGVFRMFVPRSHGGLELDLSAGLEVLEAVARADGATGWATMIGCETPHLLAKLPRSRFDAIYADCPDVILGGAVAPQGQATPAPGGFHVSGRWGFVSGCQHSDWLFGNCVVKGTGDGPPQLRAMVVPAGQAKIIDTWFALGLRGSGSHDIALDGFVPEEQTFDVFQGAPCLDGPTFVVPVFQFSCHMAAVAVGIAQGALDEVTSQAIAGRKRLYARAPLSESPVFHARLGRLDAELRAARAALHSAAGALWAACGRGPEAAFAAAPRVAATVAWVISTASSVVTACYSEGGASALRDGSPLQRRLRDVSTVTQHAVASDGWFGTAGAALLGRPFDLFAH
jgi:alkylation response protein AidB-like acyl-CoA dehydrogenase